MNTAGRSIFPASVQLACRSHVQHMPYAAMQTPSFAHEHVAKILEVSKGYLVDKSDLADALRTQQLAAAQDFRELGFHEAAAQVEDRLGVSVARPQREH
jgi:hypothetical protein